MTSFWEPDPVCLVRSIWHIVLLELASDTRTTASERARVAGDQDEGHDLKTETARHIGILRVKFMVR